MLKLRCRTLVCVLAMVALAAVVAHPASAQSVEIDTTSFVEPSWAILPSLFYSPKTKLAGGGSVRYFAGHDFGTRPTSVSATFIYTQRRQIIASIVPDLYFRSGAQRVFMSALYLKFPDIFYGIGNDTRRGDAESYSSRIGRFLLSAEQRVRPGLHLGVQTLTWRESVREAEEGGALASGAILGTGKMFVNGMGAFVRWDTRDNVYYSTAGSYVRLAWMGFGPAIGSDFSFSRTTLDARKFIPVDWRQSVGLRLYVRAAAGDTPFQLLPQVGGRLLMRGYSEGRYRDKVLVAIQAEYRLYVYGPLSFTVFGSAGDVQPNFGQFGSDRLILAGGPGIRILTNPEGLYFRVDYGVGREGGKWYITLGEAF